VQQIPAGVPVVLSIIVFLQHLALTRLVAPLRVVVHQEIRQQACLWVQPELMLQHCNGGVQNLLPFLCMLCVFLLVKLSSQQAVTMPRRSRGIETSRRLQCAHSKPHRARAKAGFGQARQACQIAVKDDDIDAGVRVVKINTAGPPADTDASIKVQHDTLHASVIVGHLLRCCSGMQDMIGIHYGSAELA